MKKLLAGTGAAVAAAAMTVVMGSPAQAYPNTTPTGDTTPSSDVLGSGASPSTGVLPSTGGPETLLLVGGVALLAVGGVAVAGVRRRAND